MLTAQNLLFRLSELELTLQLMQAKENLALDLDFDSKIIDDLQYEAMCLGKSLASVNVYKIDVFQSVVDNILKFNSSIHEWLMYGYEGVYSLEESRCYNHDD